VIQFFELRGLFSDNIPNLSPVLGWEHHAWITAVAYSCYTFKQLRLGEFMGQSKKSGTEGGGKVNLLC
jgi:hypothetical protein